jgi:hypothetical protein
LKVRSIDCSVPSSKDESFEGLVRHLCETDSDM